MQHYKYKILVIDFGSQYTQLVLRRMREFGVYSELYNWTINKSQLFKFNPNGIILSGGPYSISKKNNPGVPDFIFKLVDIPILGICYGMQIMVAQFGGSLQCFSDQGEFGRTQVRILAKNILFDGIYDYIDSDKNLFLDVWMSHRDMIISVPKDFNIIGITKYQQIAIIAHKKYSWYGVQFHPEVTHTRQGKNILKRFIIDICKCQSDWKPKNIVKSITTHIREVIKDDKVVLAFSGGIDSCVTALLLQYAINDQFIGIFVNTGLLCVGEIERFNRFCKKYQNLNIICLSEERRFLNALSGITDPEIKRKIIGKKFIEIFEDYICKFPNVTWLAQGTIYSDIIESGVSIFDASAVIKSHHNVGGLPKSMSIRLLEPIKNLFKDEVRIIGSYLGLPLDIIYHHPSPGPGIAIRILGEIKKEYCDIVRQSDQIFIEELKNENLYDKLNQAFTVFLPIQSVGIQGDRRKYTWVIALRAIKTVDFMTATWAKLPYDLLDKVSNRIVNEVSGVSRVVYDISCKPPATIEWE